MTRLEAMTRLGGLDEDYDAGATYGRVPGLRATHPRLNRRAPKPFHTSPRPAQGGPHTIQLKGASPQPPHRR
jgi:hypothetical protein